MLKITVFPNDGSESYIKRFVNAKKAAEFLASLNAMHRPTKHALDGAKAPRKSKRSTGSPRK